MNSDQTKNNIIKSFREKKNSHAFLLSTNNVDSCLEDVLDIVRVINCKNDGDKDCTCNICTTIRSGNNPDVIVLRPDGKEIKKEQTSTITKLFSTKPLINNYSIYIIVNADKMNSSSGNNLLKFLEEPEGNIIGFFITDNLQGILPTIRSRCQSYNYHFGGNTMLDLLEINEEEFGNYYDVTLNLVKLLNDNPKYVIMLEAKNLSKFERFELNVIVELLRKIYVIKYENLISNKYSDLDFACTLLESIESNDLNLIVKRIKLLDNIINDLNFNVNKELILNKLFLMWE